MPAYDEDQSLDVVRLDGLQRGNAEAGSGEHVTITVAQSRPATRVVFAPAQREMRLQGPTQALKRNFFRKPLVTGDLVATTGQQPVQNMPPEMRRMLNAPAYALTQIRLSVVSTAPKGIVHIDENTEVELRAEFEEARDGRAVVNYDDVGGMQRYDPAIARNGGIAAALPRTVHPARRRSAQGGAAARSAGNRQDAAGAGGRE